MTLGSAAFAELARELLTTAPEATLASAAALRDHVARDQGEPLDRAALGGLRSSGLGWAFACGYEAALTRLDPEATRGGVLAALCATEEGGGHPRAIRTLLVPDAAHPARYLLTGRKTWVTLGTDAGVLLVVASAGVDAGGRNRLRVARVPAGRAGVRLEPGPATPFAPEIGHARAELEGVAIGEEDLLPGDGYDAVLKPFRTLEDTHVLGAALGWGIGVARRGAWERAWIDEAVALLGAVRTIAAGPPLHPGTHVALGGALTATQRLLDAAPWERADAPVRADWARDRPLLGVAAAVRAARLEAAWRALAEPRDGRAGPG